MSAGLSGFLCLENGAQIKHPTNMAVLLQNGTHGEMFDVVLPQMAHDEFINWTPQSLLSKKGDPLLIPQHLEILRAALQFFDEEMSPHGVDAIANYVDLSLYGPVTPQHIQHLRKMLDHCQLRYAGYDRRTLNLTSNSLFESQEQMPRRTEGQGIASMLLFTGDQ